MSSYWGSYRVNAFDQRSINLISKSFCQITLKIWWKIYFSSFKLQNWGHTNVLGLKRDDELTYNRHVTHYCFASLRVSDFVFFSWHPKMAWFWIALYSHCALCWTRNCTAALLSQTFFILYLPLNSFEMLIVL